MTGFNYTDGLNLLKQQRANLGKTIEHLYYAKVETKPTEDYLETHITNYFFQLSSFEILISGTKVFPEINNDFIDLSSVFVITRAIIESYFSIHYLYFESLNDYELSKFRYLIYNIHGLNVRQEMQKEMHPNLTDRQKLIKEKETIDLYISELKQNEIFKNLREEKKKQILKSMPARDVSLTQLVAKPYFKSSIFKHTWGYLCNYAHTEFVSALQLKEIFSNPELFNTTPSLMRHPLFVTIMMNASMLINLNKRFKAAEILYNGFPTTFRKSNELWYQVSQGED